jgi:hypothetical protein
MLSATSCGDGSTGKGSSTFVASVLADDEDEAMRECMVLIARMALWCGVRGQLVGVSVGAAHRELVDR